MMSVPTSISDAIVRKATAEILSDLSHRQRFHAVPATAHHSSLSKHWERIDATIQRAWKSSTTSKYQSGVDQFLKFCSAHGIPLSDTLPASEDLLCAFASSYAGLISGKTIRNKCTAIRSWHIKNHVHYLGDQQLSYVLKGAHNMTVLASFVWVFSTDHRPPGSQAERPLSPSPITATEYDRL
ncbi:hypothetical protein Hypma_010121 [Hypsizygus marmoreus]|uniref:Core-binding (CB) domain-containing protein n=1 Tax=Hypsizygus marmoreus TaxID=39966 RepID=A0A369JLG9_HYPMA|nr:hypothetical protein Hypma_010121 [Hypsizygus marmoreus]